MRREVIAAGLAAAVIAVPFVAQSSAAFTAAITNSTNTAGAGYLAMTETSGSSTCSSNDGTSAQVATNNAFCTTINKYGANTAMASGDSSVVSLTIKNTGTVATASSGGFVVSGGSCSQSASASPSGAATDLCSKYTITIASGGTTIWSGTAAAFVGRAVDIGAVIPAAKPLAAGASLPLTVTATLGTVDNTYMNLAISQPVTWSFSR